MKMRTKVLAAGALMVAVGLGYGVGVAQGDQPHMQNALTDLQSAKAELQVAQANKGGHRAAAINLVNQAITQVEAGISYADGY